ncbi:MAG: guanylate kinase [Candidatus Edwardsbacteria bacterium]|nr:guanylate kinase [Candidatus Edwardsbacteria bacterium]
MRAPARKGFPIILTAPSGAGKTTLSCEIIKLHPEIHYSISVTSRPPRSVESDGQDYHFVSVAEFEKMLENKEFAEWAMVHDNYYGTPKKQIEERIDNGIDVIMDIDTVGARSIERLFPQAVTIFVLPPSLEVLGERLRSRATDTEEIIKKRLNQAKLELLEIGDFEYFIVNDEFEDAVAQVRAIIEAERCKLTRYEMKAVIDIR